MKNPGQRVYSTKGISNRLNFWGDQNKKNRVYGIKKGLISPKNPKRTYYIFDEQFNFITECSGIDQVAALFNVPKYKIYYYLKNELPIQNRYIGHDPVFMKNF